MTILVYERKPVTVACSVCGKDVDAEHDAHYPHEPDCPRRHTDVPCDCDLTVHAGCCPDCGMGAT